MGVTRRGGGGGRCKRGGWWWGYVESSEVAGGRRELFFGRKSHELVTRDLRHGGKGVALSANHHLAFGTRTRHARGCTVFRVRVREISRRSRGRRSRYLAFESTLLGAGVHAVYPTVRRQVNDLELSTLRTSFEFRLSSCGTVI